MFLRKRTVPLTPISLVKASAKDCSLMTGSCSSNPISDQVPLLREGGRLRLAWHRCNGAGGVVAGDGDDLSAAKAGGADYICTECAERVARVADGFK